VVQCRGRHRGNLGQGVLTVDRALLTRIADTVATPTYVYDAGTIRSQWNELTAALRRFPHEIYYSVKANSNRAVLRILRDLGAGADIVSGGELVRVLDAGFAPGRIVFSGVGKRRAELEQAVDAKVGLINLESFGEFEVLRDVIQRSESAVQVGIRVNPDVTTDTHPYTQTGEGGMKFGVPLDRVGELATMISRTPNVTLTCIGMHIGSQVADPSSYREAAWRLSTVVQTLRGDGVNSLTAVDVGGGLAVQYTDEPALDPIAFARAIGPLHEETGLRILVEPGRFLVGNAGVLLVRILYRKVSGGRTFLIVDGGMNDFARPSYYGARHDIVVIDPGANPESLNGDCDVVGPVCETGDFLGLSASITDVGVEGVLAVCGAGAYGFVMSSNYNSRTRAAEVVVDGGRFAVVREREDWEDLWRREVAEPQWIN